MQMTVSIGLPGEPLKEISRSSNWHIGRMYRYATLLLGMRPADHEYKLWGWLHITVKTYGKNAYDIYAETLQVDGLVSNTKRDTRSFLVLEDKLEGQRFDAIAYGIQRRCELLTEWILMESETGIGNIAMSVGVAQNIKANKLIGELDGLTHLFVLLDLEMNLFLSALLILN